VATKRSAATSAERNQSERSEQRNRPTCKAAAVRGITASGVATTGQAGKINATEGGNNRIQTANCKTGAVCNQQVAAESNWGQNA